MHEPCEHVCFFMFASALTRSLQHVSCLFKLTAVHLVDSHYCADPAKFISVLCTSLSTMLHVELPHVNVLSKMDLIEQYGKLGMFGKTWLYQTKLSLHPTIKIISSIDSDLFTTCTF